MPGSLSKAFRLVFSQRRYWALSLAVLVVVTVTTAIAINSDLIRVASTLPGTSTKLTLWLGIITGIPAKIGWLGTIGGMVTVILFSINASFFSYAIKQNQARNLAASGGKQVLGLVLGALGLGCAACGSLLLAPLLALFGAAGLLAILPLHGQEFGLLAILLLGYSTYKIAKAITSPLICKT